MFCAISYENMTENPKNLARLLYSNVLDAVSLNLKIVRRLEVSPKDRPLLDIGETCPNYFFVACKPQDMSAQFFNGSRLKQFFACEL